MARARSGRWWWAGLLAVLAASAVALALYWRAQRDEAPVYYGVVEAYPIEVGSLVGGRVRSVKVKEGARVRAGQPLVELETDLLDAELAEQRARLAHARATLRRTHVGPRQEELARARIAWQEAERERRRQKALLEHDATTQMDYDLAESRAASARQSYLAARRGGRPEDIRQAEASVAREQARLAHLLEQRDELVIRAPRDGVVEVLDLRPGDIVVANQSAVTLLEPAQMWVRIYVPEPSLGRVHLGQSARVTTDTYPDRPFPGRVVEIRTQAEYTPRNLQTSEQRTDQVFGVKVAVSDTQRLRPGMTAAVRLVDAEDRAAATGSAGRARAREPAAAR